MILYQKEPLALQMRNTIMLDDNATGGCIYVSKATYDQALLISSRFDGDINRVLTQVKKNDDYKQIEGIFAAMREFKDSAPEPINILAAFACCLNPKLPMSFLEDGHIKLYGVLHMMSLMLDFNAMTLVPSSVRATVDIPNIMIKGYEASWADLTHSLIDDVVLRYEDLAPSKKKKKKNVVEVDDEDEEEEVEEESAANEDIFAATLAKVEALAKEQEEEEKAKNNTSTPVQAASASTLNNGPTVATPASAAAQNEGSRASALLAEYAGLD